jgi:hypothetical protein
MLHSRTFQVDRLATSVGTLGTSAGPLPLLGYLPLVNLNAASTLAPNGEPIILLDMMLCSTLNTFTCFMLYFLSEVAAGKSVRDIPMSTHLRIGGAITSAIRTFLGHRDSFGDLAECWAWMRDSLPPHIPEEGHTLGDTLIAFVLAHEYAHHVLGHVHGTKRFRHVLPDGASSLEVVLASRQQELDADQRACEMIQHCASEESDFMPFRGLCRYGYAPLLFFDIQSHACPVITQTTATGSDCRVPEIRAMFS